VLSPDDFEQPFGPGVQFKTALVERTKDPVTRGIEGTLVWLARLKTEGKGTSVNSFPGRFSINVPYFTRDY
jgi:hypothetical protein